MPRALEVIIERSGQFDNGNKTTHRCSVGRMLHQGPESRHLCNGDVLAVPDI
jgi:hypothetical protein